MSTLATPISLDTTVNGIVNPTDTTNLYHFAGTAGTSVYVDSLSDTTTESSGYTASWAVIDQYGATLASNAYMVNDLGRIDLPHTGNYTIVVQGNLAAADGIENYSLRVHSVADSTTPLTLNTAVNTNTTIPGQARNYTFTLGAPTSLYFDSRTNDGGVQWKLKGPQGNVVGETSLSSDDNVIGLMPAGSYTLTINRNDGGIGGFGFNLLDMASATAIDAGDPTIVFDPMEFDQRGDTFARVLYGQIDIGAIEGAQGSPLLAINDSATTNEDTSVVVSVLTNDTPTGEVQILGVQDGSDGSVTNNGDGTVTYTPDTGFTGTDSFDYTIALNDVELVSSAASGGDRFGNAVAIDGDFAVVGSYLDDPSSVTSSGSAFVYRRTGETTWTQVAQLTGDLDANGIGVQFGYSVAIDGDTVAVSAQKDRQNGFQAGAIYVFDRNQGGVDNWGLVKKIIGGDTTTRDLFGRSIALSGNTIVVGASVADPVGQSSGAAYVFERNLGGAGNWGQSMKLVASNGAAEDRFGQSVSIDGDLIAVGAFRHDGLSNDTGAVYVFGRDTGGAGNWGEDKAIEAGDAVLADQFGYSVSIDGGFLAVGARQDDEGGLNQRGSVYLFGQDEGGVGNWGQVTKILASDALAGDRLGWSVDLSGDRLVDGAIGSDIGGSTSGNAYLFENIAGVWTQTRSLSNDKVTAADEYGFAVAVDADVAVVGSWLDNRPSNNSGGAYVFDLHTSTATVNVSVTEANSEMPLVNRAPANKQGEAQTLRASDVDAVLELGEFDLESLPSMKRGGVKKHMAADGVFVESENKTGELDSFEMGAGLQEDAMAATLSLLSRQSHLQDASVDGI
ncbi:hypothetical protein Pla22_30600 [Rubripirellula amarantea]|uniref:FG-GAP repeat protein n=2 Tax=Rubripirellula amarantea TaxID=2527999 RepID=A0A5C5WHQ2_9BACT|nr:hypothetical protein Pla22_30600 [Rubripirellula amarantea]